MRKKYRIVKGYYGYHPQVLKNGFYHNIGVVNYHHTHPPYTFNFSLDECKHSGYKDEDEAFAVIEEYEKSLQEVKVVWEGE